LLARGPNGAPTASACLDSSACTSDAACTLQVDDAYRVDNRYSLACGAPPATPVSCRADWDCPTWYLDSNTFCSGGVCRNTPCGANSDCPSGVCIGRCTDPCRTADDCPTGGPFDATAPACEYAFVTSEGRKDVFPVCIYRSRSAARENGEACTTHAECRDDLCVDALGRTAPPEGTPKACAGACCNDAQCGAGQCRPIFVGTSWEMRCLPRRTFDQGGGGASSG
jgi:hypothetical protein